MIEGRIHEYDIELLTAQPAQYGIHITADESCTLGQFSEFEIFQDKLLRLSVLFYEDRTAGTAA